MENFWGALDTYFLQFSLRLHALMQEIKWTGWRLKTFFTAGAVLWMISGVGIFVLPSKMHNYMYFLSVIVGISNALMTVCKRIHSSNFYYYHYIASVGPFPQGIYSSSATQGWRPHPAWPQVAPVPSPVRPVCAGLYKMLVNFVCTSNLC